MTEPFHELGREANNELACLFEDQLVAMSESLGWTVICRNIDAFVHHQGQSQSRGYDILAVVRDPQLGRREGCVLEGKRHEDPAYGPAIGEVQTLHDKITRLSNTEAFWANPAIRKQLDAPLLYGFLCHRTFGFDPQKAQARREDAELHRRKLGVPVPVIQFLGSDVLEALAHLAREYQPKQWLWPPMRRRDARWSSTCSPWTLIGGMAAFRGADGRQRFWLHDELDHGDVDLLEQVLLDWGVNPVELVCTGLRQETWRLLKDDWMRVVDQTSQRRRGRVPAEVRPLQLSDRLTTFDHVWASAA